MTPGAVSAEARPVDVATPVLLRVGTLLAQIAALPSIGIDTSCIDAAIREAVGELPSLPDALVPVAAYGVMWRHAQAVYARPGLATALGMAIPFGSLGAIDYLAGSAATVAGLIASLEQHLSIVATDTQLTWRKTGDGDYVVCARVAGDGLLGEEFTLAVIASRLLAVTDGRVRPSRVLLPASMPDPPHQSAREAMFGAPVAYAQPVSALVLAAADWLCELGRADPYLHATMLHLATQAQITPRADITDFELAIRARLRDALAASKADPARMARLLGLSERTLQRRLAELGRSYSSIVEDFRREEAALLLTDGRHALVEVASRLGYAEQTSFSRAFRRWHGQSPAAWRRLSRA